MTDKNENSYGAEQIKVLNTSKAPVSTTYTKTEVDNALALKNKAITSGTGAPSGGSDGDIYIQYI